MRLLKLQGPLRVLEIIDTLPTTAFKTKERKCSLSTWCSEGCKLAMISYGDFDIKFFVLVSGVFGCSLHSAGTFRVSTALDFWFVQGTSPVTETSEVFSHLSSTLLYLMFNFNKNILGHAFHGKFCFELIFGLVCQFHF